MLLWIIKFIQFLFKFFMVLFDTDVIYLSHSSVVICFYVFTYLFPIYYLFIEANNWSFDSNNIHDYYDFNLILAVYFQPTPTHPPLISGRTSSLFIL